MAHNHPHSNNATRNISIAFFLNLFFVLVELIGGLITNSIAILTDALHDSGDCLSLATAWFLQRKSKQGRDSKFSYGYKRFSLLGSIFLSGVLALSAVFVVVEAGKRLFSPQEVSAQGMFWLAVVGIVINGAAALRVKKGTSINERAVFLHIMEDVLGWVAVLVVSIIMLFVNVPILDPLLSIGISIWVLSNVYKNLRNTFRILLQSVPNDVPMQQLEERLRGIKGIQSIHDLHVWSMDGESHVMTLHIVTEETEVALLKKEVVKIGEEYHIDHTTIEVEHLKSNCGTRCD